VPSSKRNDPFEALAHPIRRDILVLLRDEPGITAGTIAARFPIVSRPAVSRHLGILRGARLVRSRAEGREERYRLVPGALASARSWLDGFDTLLDGSLARLKSAVENDE
jgi:DNA-binding transcriptional ArsR family regulator